ncbi:MAG: hypothetical protein ACI9UA_000129 [Pseudoalteromonas tetraodonis]|jgi:hypothetical protein
MKQALQNPFIVGILAILALGYVVRTILKKPPSAYSAAIAAQEASEAEKSKKGKSESSQKRIDAALAEWTVQPERNPFRSQPAEEAKGLIAAEDPAALGSEVPDLKLSAIWLDKGRKLAVINGRVVDVGDRILDFQVTEILPDRIILNGSGHQMVIRFSQRLERAVQRVAYHITEP